MDAVPIALFWMFAVWALAGQNTRLLYLFFGSMAFGSFAVIPPGVTGGLTFTPTPIVALMIIARTLTGAEGITFTITSALMPRRLGLLFLFWVVSVFTTIFMPRLFAGQVEIISMRGLVTGSSPLGPSTQNISQLAYLTISVFAVFAFAKLLQHPVMRQHTLSAMCFGAAMVIGTGFLDYASQFLPITPLLEPFRTATYALLTDNEVLGAKRVVGLMPEASAFGGLCFSFLAALYFFRRAMVDARLRDRVVPVLLSALALLAWLSTSSTAYVGMILFALVAGLEWSWRAAFLRHGALRRRGLAVEFWVVLLALGVLTTVILFRPSLLDPVVAQFDRMVFQKTSTQSFEQRGMWTAVSLQAFFDTYGLGVGMGGTRASNAVVAVFSNLGLLAGVLYYAFVLQSLMRRARFRADESGAALISAFRWSFLPSFVMGMLSGTSADFGSFGAFRYGLVAAVAFTAVKKASSPSRMVEEDRRTIKGSANAR